jgi:hypothetical protein
VTWTFEAETWRWQARSDSWIFVTVPPEVSEQIADIPRPPSGFGSVRVRVCVGQTRWGTSVFPDAARGCYVLAIKKAVRAAEGIEEGAPVLVELELG